ncbi:MAG: DNA polymerase IV [Microbacterium sp. SCN 70-200]|uniref:DNA polymerase IV n=1 Tax=unclassified Microbacterium TaxID=2609290 RepID=UPI00086AEDCA|nr:MULTISPECIES: DNA polymerase IV [unclassified Microbacterium]MBN9214541.1 DNA polymerase IV [Microbacterium sp.]ODT41435.1 MAG: DNA polymerase IV [Microbacterium sp. SCN 70-200]OJV84085.1 MAG: DNA polymerase IV [Microbacterium sp. 70-16]
MGRGDGSGRRVSAADADDTGTRILHVDMDAFYASVEVLDDPSLAGKPVIVGGMEGRGVVSSATYEARRFGVRSAMNVAQALRLCPHAIVVVPHFERYAALSRQVMAIFHDVTPLVEPLSIDEAFLDVSGARRLWGSPGEIARMLRARVKAETGLVCSIGVAATKHVAKIASTLSKPDGLLIVSEPETAQFLAGLPVRALWGVGPKAAEALEARGIRLVSDILASPQRVIERALGPAGGARIWQLAHGEDPRTVETERIEKSIGHEETFLHDIADAGTLRSELRRLSDRVAARLRDGGWEAATVALKLRYADFTTISRASTLPEPTDVGQRIGDVVTRLFDAVELSQPVRLIGVRAEKLRPGGTGGLALWDDDEDWRRVDTALDDARERFGGGAVTRASTLGPRRDVNALPTNPRLPREH